MAEHRKGGFYELAHGWRRIADVTTEDRINEGGAEFSAFWAAKEIYGTNYAAAYIAECINEIGKAAEKISIVETDADSKDRYIHHYLKTTLLFIQAEKMFGSDHLFALLRKGYQTHKKACDATTGNFLSLCEEDMRPYFTSAFIHTTGRRA